MRNFPEQDWKQLRALQERMLATACERVLNKIESIVKDRKGREHEAYLELWKILRHEDKDIAMMFDDLRRSNAIMKLASWKANNLLSDHDLESFTEETQHRLKVLEKIGS